MKQTTLIFVLTCLFLSSIAVAQNQCYLCSSQSNLRSVKVGKESRYLCHDCRSKAQVCDLCRRQGDHELMQDGRRVCAGCKSTKILTQAQLEDVYKKVKVFLKSDPAGLMVSDPPPVKLADKDEIQTKFTRSGRAMDVAGFYSPYNPEEIFILSGQSPDSCGATIVHEYAHAWQSRNCPSQDRAVTEGFASWVEYRYLMSLGQTQTAQQLTRKSDPDYGASLIKLLEMEKQVGVDGVVKFAKTATALP